MASVVFGPSFVEAVVAYGQGSIQAGDVEVWTAPDALDQFLKSRNIPKSSELGSHFMSLVCVQDIDEPGASMKYDAGFHTDAAVGQSVVSMVFPVRDC